MRYNRSSHYYKYTLVVCVFVSYGNYVRGSSVCHSRPRYAGEVEVMDNQQAKQTVQEMHQSSIGELMNTTSKTPTLDRSGKLVIFLDKVPKLLEGAVMVTSSVTSTSGKERKRLVKESGVEQQPSFVDLQQQSAEIDQIDREELPKFVPVQEFSTYSHEMPPSVRGLLPPSDGDSNPPSSGTSLDN